MKDVKEILEQDARGVASVGDIAVKRGLAFLRRSAYGNEVERLAKKALAAGVPKLQKAKEAEDSNRSKVVPAALNASAFESAWIDASERADRMSRTFSAPFKAGVSLRHAENMITEDVRGSLSITDKEADKLRLGKVTVIRGPLADVRAPKDNEKVGAVIDMAGYTNALDATAKETNRVWGEFREARL